LFDLYEARNEYADQLLGATNELQRVTSLHANDPTHPEISAARNAAITMTTELADLNTPTATARDEYTSLRTATAALSATMDTQAAAFLTTYGYPFNAAMPPTPPSDAAAKRPMSPIDLARAALDRATAAATTAALAVSEGETLFDGALSATPVDPPEIARLALALRASKAQLQAATTTQISCQQTFDSETTPDAASKRARLASESGSSVPLISVSLSYKWFCL